MASGKPDPTISWRHITPLAKKYESGEYLMINGINRDQAGDYECSAQNDISYPDTKTVKVTVNFAPEIREIKSAGVGRGRTALLRCEAAAVPTPVFEWYKGDKKLTKGQGIDIKNHSSRSVLSMTNMTEDGYGNYTCVAANELGKANASLPLIPIIEPTTTSPVSSPEQCYVIGVTVICGSETGAFQMLTASLWLCHSFCAKCNLHEGQNIDTRLL
ncbi:hypothetical protein SKAU_G00070150 [Synaphobranchus kaupii]|uniref:Ig-like domain-containing protein n=1 Tax=Synaphobranchus kaupii TaxID=118154 RepID=A0A9Q1G6S6_SYNKA|nr:hypothetical protein SKAU_G00070150 [Synaphobranchus kaupii]